MYHVMILYNRGDSFRKEFSKLADLRLEHTALQHTAPLKNLSICSSLLPGIVIKTSLTDSNGSFPDLRYTL